MNKTICITGMHRSGTSLITSWLELCGLSIHDGNLIGIDVGNPKGHFEDQDFVDLHSSATMLANPKSKNWKILTQKSLTFANEHLSSARDLVRQRNERHKIWGWKDPRTVLFLKEWKKIIPTLKVLLIWRPCFEVAHSILKRSKKATRDVFKIKLTESVKLWISYNLRVTEYRRKYPNDTLLFPLEYVVNHSQDVLRLVNSKFQTKLTYRPISDVYDSNLLHKSSTHSLIRLISYYYNSSRLEKILMHLSDNA